MLMNKKKNIFTTFRIVNFQLVFFLHRAMALMLLLPRVCFIPCAAYLAYAKIFRVIFTILWMLLLHMPGKQFFLAKIFPTLTACKGLCISLARYQMLHEFAHLPKCFCAAWPFIFFRHWYLMNVKLVLYYASFFI